ncbi:hypothetical protein [Vulcanisaeta sp. JCM 16161]|uniref:hypothetical protein n=1 Tax=Vulcanisaeta sp. JCM 16161 TaxID=1295372 RepID=UPI000AAD5948|nr:hypothetical protein [Vulcanisaeta sp. JCM 16161]
MITGSPGSGKSMIIELIWRVFRGIRDRLFLEDLPRIGDARLISRYCWMTGLRRDLKSWVIQVIL